MFDTSTMTSMFYLESDVAGFRAHFSAKACQNGDVKTCVFFEVIGSTTVSIMMCVLSLHVVLYTFIRVCLLYCSFVLFLCVVIVCVSLSLLFMCVSVLLFVLVCCFIHAVGF